jgi:hypothetical protein
MNFIHYKNAIENLYGSLWLIYFTRIPYQIRRINWSKINSYFKSHQALFNKYSSTIISLGCFSLLYAAKGKNKS